MRREAFQKELPLIIFVLVLICGLLATIFISNRMSDEIVAESPTIVETHERETLPVVSENNYITNPYIDPSVTVGREYYDYQGEEEKQQNSLTIQNNTYYQNTGIDYIKEEVFDVIAIQEGTVNLVKEDDLVGKVVEIEHNNGLISIYQSLGEVMVKKGDIVMQGQVIGKSGNNEMEKDLGNHLHFEIYENGQSVNPINYLNKEYKKEN